MYLLFITNSAKTLWQQVPVQFSYTHTHTHTHTHMHAHIHTHTHTPHTLTHTHTLQHNNNIYIVISMTIKSFWINLQFQVCKGVTHACTHSPLNHAAEIKPVAQRSAHTHACNASEHSHEIIWQTFTRTEHLTHRKA